MNIPTEGHLEFWNSQPFMDAANILIAADEPLRALKLLENLPGFYRDFIPPEIIDLKRRLLKQLATNTLYSNRFDTPLSDAIIPELMPRIEPVLRWQKISQDVQSFNYQGKTPHIVDMGPGEYWLPLALKHKGFKFTYLDINTCIDGRRAVYEQLKNHLLLETPTDRPLIFVACEIIEHLHHEEDILAECVKLGVKPGIIHLSTPKYTFDTSMKRIDWEKCGDLGHLRTYTLNDFYRIIQKMFPDYELALVDSKILHCRGVLRA